MNRFPVSQNTYMQFGIIISSEMQILISILQRQPIRHIQLPNLMSMSRLIRVTAMKNLEISF